MLWFLSILLGSIFGSLAYKVGLGHKEWEDIMEGIISGLLFTLVCYAILFSIF